MEDATFIIFWFLLFVVLLLLAIKNKSKLVNQKTGEPTFEEKYCEICNQSIPKERLVVAPDSVLCFSCKTNAEKKQGSSFPRTAMDISSDYEQNHFDPYDDFDVEENGISSNEDETQYFKVGLEAFKQGNYNKARKYFQLLKSYYHDLGLIYGEKVVEDNPDCQEDAKLDWEASSLTGENDDQMKHVKFFQLSNSYYYLGLIYEDGLGVNQDYQEAAKLYWEASNITGEAYAQVRLGRMFQDGRGVKRDYSEAIKYYDKAKANCKEDEKAKILDLIASNIIDIENEDLPYAHANLTAPMKVRDSFLHPKIKLKIYDKNNYELEILSVAAGKTKSLIDQYYIHSCPDYYAYKRTKYITFRAGSMGEMDALYEIDKILTIPIDARDDLDILEGYGLTSYETQRLINYMKKNPFPKNNRYYILSGKIGLPERPRPPKVNAKTIYYSLNQLTRKS